ncbi:PIG-L family deacetylase [Candidatus Woesearchaeota archaeon]|nr:PIG-L family deacetylase [Candidatus Woesearchaeota archaeon]
MKKNTMKETIIVCGAHSDDFVIGAGGTIAKYTIEGKKVIAVIFSYGENSHPWLKEEIVQKMRTKETLEASKILGCSSLFYDLKEIKFLEEYKKKGVEDKLLRLIEKEKPVKVFTHSIDDPHPDHKAVYEITCRILDKVKSSKPELYVYSVWNPVSFRTLNPVMFIDISKMFKLKLKALQTFRSQKVHIVYPFILLLFRAIKDGLMIRKRFGEKFYRLR